MREKIYAQLAYSGINSNVLGELLEASVNQIKDVFGGKVDNVLICTKVGENKLPSFSSAWFTGGENLFYEVKMVSKGVSLDRAKVAEIHHAELTFFNWDISAEPSDQAGISIRVSFENNLTGSLFGVGKNSLTVLNFYKKYFMPLLI